MHKSLRCFTWPTDEPGVIGDDADFPRLRSQFETYLLRQMRDEGFAPVLDLGPFWSTEYDEKNNSYSFKLSMHGYYVGRRRVCEIEGITAQGKVIPRSTPPDKSKPSSKKSK